MCETADFYKCFSEYKYLFIYQLDGWIFEDNVQKYLDLDVDYIGSPWNVGSFNLSCDTIGNGGVSLRKVQKFIDVCNSFTPEDYEKEWVKTEDLFFCKTMKTKANFKLPSVQVGSNFSLCGLWGRFMTKYNDGKLPMCLHGWHRDYSSYWKRYINLDGFETTGDIKVVQQPIQSVQKSDYKTRLELIKMKLNKSDKPINIQAPAKIENTKIENKKEIIQKTTMSSGYANFFKDYYGIKKPMKWENDKQTTNKQQAPAKPAVPTKKAEEKKVEVKQEVKQEIIDPNQHINILIVHYNTPYLTECLIKSINKFVGYNCTIYIFDNSDKLPFTYRQSNIKIFDNTKGQIINFDEELKKYPNHKYSLGSRSKWGSFKHCTSVDKCFDLINDNFILLDSDILLKKNISNLFDNNYYSVGEIMEWSWGPNKNIYPVHKRICPFITFINVIKSKLDNIRYFNDQFMDGLYDSTHHNNKEQMNKDSYDTGCWFYEKIQKKQIKEIKHEEYIVHFRGGSYTSMGRNEHLTQEQWLNKYKDLYTSNKKKNVIYTCITGGYDKIVEPTNISKEYDYICFTDNMSLTSNIWKIKEIPNEIKTLDNTRINRYIKTHPHLLFPEYETSIYIDGSIKIIGDIDKFIQTCELNNYNIVIPKHPDRICLYKEAKVCRNWKDTAQNIDLQIQRYKSEGFPENYGLTQNNIIIRNHNNKECIKIMEDWWKEILNGSYRDQLSLMYVLWNNPNIKIKQLPSNTCNSSYFKWDPYHNKK